jgi:hypothetical protein
LNNTCVAAHEEFDKCDIKNSLQMGYALSLLAVSKDFFFQFCVIKKIGKIFKKIS